MTRRRPGLVRLAILAEVARTPGASATHLVATIDVASWHSAEKTLRNLRDEGLVERIATGRWSITEAGLEELSIIRDLIA